jgi:hypothetical protein
MNTEYSYAKARRRGLFVPNFTSRKGFPGRCAINTETSAVKYLRVRFRSGGMVAVFVLYKRWQIDSFRSAIQGHRVRQVARLWGECVVVRLPLCPWMVERFFQHGGGRQAMRRTPNPGNVGALPTRRAIFINKNAVVAR